MRAAAIALALLATTAVAAAVPTASDPVDDQVGVLGSAERAIEQELIAMRGEASVDMAVVIVATTGGVPIERYARGLAERWASGRTAAAVLVLALNERASRLEVSDALRPKFPDQRAKSILDNSRGYLRDRDFAGAVRAIIGEVKAAAMGIAPDLESPHPPTGDPPAGPEPAVGTHPVPEPTRYRPSHADLDYTPLIAVLVIVGVLLGIGALWAWQSRKASGTFSHDGARLQRSFVADWLWCTLKIIGGILVVLLVIAAASSSSRGSSSRSWSSSSSSRSSWSGGGGGSSGRGGGWSGGGASSSW